MTVVIRSTPLKAPARLRVASLAPRAGWRRNARPRPVGALVRVGVRPDADPPVDIVDQWGEQSFPASDPPANW
jgi:hypothetical protein